MKDDRMFWERLAEMPLAEQEQECVLRREHCSLQTAMLRHELLLANERKDSKEAKRLGVAIFEIGSQNTLLNERIKYLRRLDDKTSWREAVRTVLGEDAYEACVAWRIQQEVAEMPFSVPA